VFGVKHQRADLGDNHAGTSCAIRSNGSMVKVDWPRFQQETISWP
jgi:hypothetical protein